MVGDERVLAICGMMEEQNNSILQRIDKLEQGMNQSFDKLECRMEQVESEIQNIWLVIENELRGGIGVMAENFPDLQQIKDDKERLGELESYLKMLTLVVEEHSGELLKIKRIRRTYHDGEQVIYKRNGVKTE